MAANYQQIYPIKANMQTLRNMIRSKEFADQLRIEFKSENPTDTGVWYRFLHGVTFSSWGEKITITLTPCGGDVTQVTIHSECGMPTQVMDWGKNKQNVCNVYEFLEANVSRYVVAQQPTQPTAQQAAPAAAAKFCGQCGAPVVQGSNFCGQCGARLK